MLRFMPTILPLLLCPTTDTVRSAAERVLALQNMHITGGELSCNAYERLLISLESYTASQNGYMVAISACGADTTA